jgi:hypothetical protein
MRNNINIHRTHLIYKSTIGFMRLTLGQTNSVVDLKLYFTMVCRGCIMEEKETCMSQVPLYHMKVSRLFTT